VEIKDNELIYHGMITSLNNLNILETYTPKQETIIYAIGASVFSENI